MIWKIIFYIKENLENPVRDFILDLQNKERAKVAHEIEILEKEGIYPGYPHTSKIIGKEYKGLWELRIRFGKNNFRIIYFLYIKNTFVLLHGFKKKTNATLKKDLETAKKRMIEYKKRKR